MSDSDANAGASKLWGLLFLLVPIGAVAGGILAPKSWWLPPAASEVAADIDSLFMLITWVTGIAFILTNLLLAYTLLFTKREGRSTYTHGNHQLEIVWSVVPGILLVFLAFYQRGTWADIKHDVPAQPGVEVRVIAKQFDWTAIYPGPDGELDTDDDIQSSRLIVPKGKDVLVHLASRDVLHSFFLPQMRIKQDAVPGMIIPVWFKAEETTEEYARNHGVHELLIDNMEDRASKPFTDAQKAVLLDLARSPEPLAPRDAVKAARAAYEEKEARAKASFGDDALFDELKAMTFGQRQAGIDQVRTWTYPIVCAELCGQQHWYMKGSVLVVEPEQFDTWLKERSR